MAKKSTKKSTKRATKSTKKSGGARGPGKSKDAPTPAIQAATVERVEALEGNESFPTSNPPDLIDFFTSVGHGIAGAQRALDEESRKYSDERIAQNRPEQATAFRIPKVSAEINFMISEVRSNGFNVILASKKEELEQRQNQKVSFDVVATPAPPDFISEVTRQGAVAATMFRESLVLSTGTRAELKDRLAAAAITTTVPSLKNTINNMFLPDFSRVVCMAAGADGWLLFTTAPGAELWALYLDGGTGAPLPVDVLNGLKYKDAARAFATAIDLLAGITSEFLTGPRGPGTP